MNKQTLLPRLKQLKENVDAAKGLIDESVVVIANQLINYAKEHYKEDLRDLTEIKTAKYDFGEKGSQQEISAKLGQAIAVLEADIEGPACA